MVPLKKLWLLLPVGLAVTAVGCRSVVVGCLAVAAVFCVVAMAPVCRDRESVWIFVILFLTVLPMDLPLVAAVLETAFFRDAMGITNLFRGGIMLVVLISIQEIACGILARVIWRRQKKALLVK